MPSIGHDSRSSWLAFLLMRRHSSVERGKDVARNQIRTMFLSRKIETTTIRRQATFAFSIDLESIFPFVAAHLRVQGVIDG